MINSLQQHSQEGKSHSHICICLKSTYIFRIARIFLSVNPSTECVYNIGENAYLRLRPSAFDSNGMYFGSHVCTDSVYLASQSRASILDQAAEAIETG